MAAKQEAEETVSKDLHSPSELRIVLLGGRWAGKSEAGNTILDREEFRSGFSRSAVTRKCEKRTGEVAGRRVTVVDTPDFLDTDRVEIDRCVSLSAPGPHAFLLVIPVFPKETNDTHCESILIKDCKSFDKVQQLNKVQELFGEGAVRNMMILFTRGDYLEGRSIEQYIYEDGEEQRVQKCGNRYHVISNVDRSDHTQVTQLLDKIDNMVKRTGGCYLPNEIYQEVEERIRLKEQELNEKHKEELSKKEEVMYEKYEEEQCKREKEMKKKYEKDKCRREEEMKQKYEEEQSRREEEMKQKYEEEQSRREEDVKQKYKKEQSRREEDIKQKYKEEQSRREEDVKQKYKKEQSRREEDIKQKYKEEQSRREEEMKQKYEEEQCRREEEMKQKYKKEQYRREKEMKQKYEEEQSRREEEMKQKYEEEQSRREEEMKQKYEEEQSRREEEMMEKLRKQMKEEELEKEPEDSNLPVRRRTSNEILPPKMSGGEGEAPLADIQAPPSPPELRMVLLGKTGAGKSAAGNTILGREEFRSEASSSALTRECEKRKGQVAGRRVAVIDTPELSQDKLQIRSCVSLSAPGPHAFLLVIPVGRFTEEERRAVETVQEIFSEETVRRYIMLLFTHSDTLKGQSIKKYIKKQNRDLRQLLQKCGNRYHVLNNEDRSDHTQVTQLLDKIDNMVKGNNGRYYTSEIYCEGKERARVGYEKSKLLKERPGELELQLELRRKREKSNTGAEERDGGGIAEERERKKRRESEKRERGEQKGKFSWQKYKEKPTENQYLRPSVVVTGGSVGAAIGAVAGAITGPVGAVAGAVLGAAAGVVIGTILGTAAGATLRRVTGSEVGAEAVKEPYKTQ
ncbi:trichohyalin-like [Acipenser ruthenus]|uniref:trichohyalin-like n=1 Tax=Acipenser ruthenus TaxID=7906 RepID=UPI002741B4E8|nr:trichohyalin-like [Acipenser ruthenus]